MKEFRRGRYSSRSLPLTSGELSLKERSDYKRKSLYLLDDALFVQYWQPENSEKVVLFATGYGEYSGRWAKHFGQYLDAGYTVVSFDHFGNGRSSGVHGLIHGLADFVDPFDAVIRFIGEQFPACSKLFILSDSSAATAALLYTVKYRPPETLIGMALVCPLIKIRNQASPNAFVRFIAKMLRRVYPALPLSPAGKGNAHEDPRVEEEFEADDGGYSGWMRVATGLTFLDAMEAIKTRFADLTVSFFVMHGAQDMIIDIEGSEQLLQETIQIPEDKKILRVYDGGHHVLWEGQPVFQDALQYFESF
ncbi:hypothetical protein MIR68_006122 [Amoeboaphelidium protococcarum]|nr:hypothetical protein MIR68_006122 [Amoeboaphelidium protococcarum]